MINNPYAVINTLLVTERATELADELNKYTFKVDRKANKREVRRAVEAIFDNVKVSSVNIMNVQGKRKRLRSSRYGKRPDWKKAIVTLSEGSIEIL